MFFKLYIIFKSDLISESTSSFSDEDIFSSCSQFLQIKNIDIVFVLLYIRTSPDIMCHDLNVGIHGFSLKITSEDKLSSEI
jgi:hypothetical protein